MFQKPIAFSIISIALILFGYLSLSRLPVDLLPGLEVPSLLVQTEWPGVTVQEIEQRINEPMESYLSTLPGMEKITSIAKPGISLISVSFQWGTDMDIAFLNTREKLDQVRYILPEEAGRPLLIHSNPSDEPVMTIAVSQKNIVKPTFEDELQIKRWVELVFIRRLEQLAGVAQAVPVGAVQAEVSIRFKEDALSAHQLSLSELQMILKSANEFTASGEIRDGWYRYAVNIESRLTSLKDIRELPVKKSGESILMLGDIAEIKWEKKDPISFSYINGHSVLTVLVKKEFGANTVSVVEKIFPVIQQLSQTTPGIQLEVVKESANFISQSIENVIQSLLLGGILAFMILFFYLKDIRLPFTIGISIPVSLCATFILMYLADISLNIISLGGLTLGIGLLVDNSIVVLENISRYREDGNSPLLAAQKGVKEIAFAITASTLTTISVFLPLLVLGGFEGLLFREQALTLTFSLFASLLVALTVLPVMVVWITKRAVKNVGKFSNLSKGMDWLLAGYEKGLGYALTHKKIVLLGSIIFILFGFFLAWLLPAGLFPNQNPNRVTAMIQLKENTSIETTGIIALQWQDRIKMSDQWDTTRYVLSIGGYSDQANLAQVQKEGQHKFTISIPVTGYQQADIWKQKLSDWVKGQNEWGITFYEGEHVLSNWLSVDPTPVILTLNGEDRKKSLSHLSEIEDNLQINNLQTNLNPRFYEKLKVYSVTIKDDRLSFYNISRQEIIQQIEAIGRGKFATEWKHQDDRLTIRFFRDKQSDLSQTYILNKGRQIPLSDLAFINTDVVPEELERVNQMPLIRVETDFTLLDWFWRKDLIISTVQNISISTGLDIGITGMAPYIDTMMSELSLLLWLSVLLIYIILVIQYEHLGYPLLILLSVPFAWVGSFVLMTITNTSINLLSFMGILILTGIAVNDAILKVDFMRRYFQETGNLDQAIFQAGHHRFRPVMMTSLTTILGLLPMLIPFGEGYEFRQGLAVALIGGMISGTLLTLFVIPILFKFIHQIKLGKQE